MLNPYFSPLPPAPPDPAIIAFHRSLPGYAPTPLHNVAGIHVKDESKRFGLRAFKALGASYAIHHFTQAHPGRHTFCCATAGNHGRAVAWTARRLGHSAVIYMSRSAQPARVAAIEAEGARVVLVDGTYDDAVIRAAADSASQGWQVICDTAYDGYTEIPLAIMDGYRTVFSEVPFHPDIVFVQVGVGGLAYAAVKHFGDSADVIAVEPERADCCRASIRSPGGERVTIPTSPGTVMDCLNCGTPSLIAWPALRAGIRRFVTVDDASVIAARRTLSAHMDCGFNGAVGFAAAVSSTEGKNVLVINTEGNVNNVVD